VRAALGRFVDDGAIFAGFVGLGMATIIVIALELIVAIQSLVFLVAPLGGLLIGWYANARSERRRPWSRVLANALYAGAVAGVALALFYGMVRLVFVYGDSGYRDDLLGGSLECASGPACTYARYLAAGGEEDLRAAGVTDAATFEAFLLRRQLEGGLILVGLSVAGALGGGLFAGRSGDRPAQARAGAGAASGA
jgi:hypothetical protein